VSKVCNNGPRSLYWPEATPRDNTLTSRAIITYREHITGPLWKHPFLNTFINQLKTIIYVCLTRCSKIVFSEFVSLLNSDEFIFPHAVTYGRKTPTVYRSWTRRIFFVIGCYKWGLFNILLLLSLFIFLETPAWPFQQCDVIYFMTSF
jgi:hypothetical protein